MRRPRRARPTVRGGPLDGAPKAKNDSGILAVLVVLAVVLGVWLLNGRDPGSPSSVGPDPTPTVATSQGVDPASGLPYVDLLALPPEAGETVGLIDRDGPFPYDKDGSTFGNFEGLLPDRSRGYYAEYTVDTPGSDDRGARRIVAGDEGELYWTADHYSSFSRIRR